MKTVNELITEAHLEGMNFEKQPDGAWKNDVFRVKLNYDDKENPLISVDEVIGGGNIVFPGAYTVKDLRDIMFFYYGENEYTRISSKWAMYQ